MDPITLTVAAVAVGGGLAWLGASGRAGSVAAQVTSAIRGCNGEELDAGVDKMLAGAGAGAAAGPYGAAAGAGAGALDFLSGPCGPAIEDKLKKLAREGEERARKALRDVDAWRLKQSHGLARTVTLQGTRSAAGKAVKRGVRDVNRAVAGATGAPEKLAKAGAKKARKSVRSTRKKARKAGKKLKKKLGL